jgi:hypothetical protein
MSYALWTGLRLRFYWVYNLWRDASENGLKFIRCFCCFRAEKSRLSQKISSFRFITHEIMEAVRKWFAIWNAKKCDTFFFTFFWHIVFYETIFFKGVRSVKWICVMSCEGTSHVTSAWSNFQQLSYQSQFLYVFNANKESISDQTVAKEVDFTNLFHL